MSKARTTVLGIIRASNFDTDVKEAAYEWAQKVEEPVCQQCGNFGCDRDCFIRRVVNVCRNVALRDIGAEGFDSIDDIKQHLEDWVK